MPQHPSPSHRLRWAGRNVAVGTDRDPLRVHSLRVGLEVTQLLLLLGVQPPLTNSLFWRLLKVEVLAGHTSITSQTGWHAEIFDLKRLLLLSLLCLAPGSQATDYVQCEAIQRAAARLKAAIDTEALASSKCNRPACNGESQGKMFMQDLSTMRSSTAWGGEWLHTRQKEY